VDWGWGGAGRVGDRKSRGVVGGDGDEWNELKPDTRD
jgi:hypothetical protein